MTGLCSAFVLSAMLGLQGSLLSPAQAQSAAPRAEVIIVADDAPAPAPENGLRQRAEELARAASERFSEIMSGSAKPKEQMAQSTAPPAQGAKQAPRNEGEAFRPVWDWLARSSKDYDDVIVAKLRNPSGEVVILAPQGTAVVEQKGALPQVAQVAPAEAPTPKAEEPRSGWSWGAVEEGVRDWLARANRSYRNEIVKQLKQPPPETEPQWPPAEVVPQAPTPADVAAEEEEERRAAEVRRAAEEAEAQRKREAEAAEAKKAEEKRLAEEAAAKQKAEAEAKRVADEAAAKQKADAEAKRVAEEAEAQRKADAEAKRVADEADAKRKADADAKRLADEAAAKQRAEAEAKRAADETEAKRKAEAEAETKKLAEEAEAKKAEENRLAAEAEAKRKAEAETARRLKDESERERKAVAEAEATRLAAEAEAKRAAAAGRKPAHENSSVAVAPPRAPARAVIAEPGRKARKEVLAAEPEPPKVVKKKRRVAVGDEPRAPKLKRKQHVAQEHGRRHRAVIVEELVPKRAVRAYREQRSAAPQLPVRNKAREAGGCDCPRSYRAAAPKRLHRVSKRVRHAYSAPRYLWRSCGPDSFAVAAPWTHQRKQRRANLIFYRPRLYMLPERY